MKGPFPVVIFLFLLFTSIRLHTDILGLSLGTISFTKSNKTFPPGLYIMPGLNINLSETLEIELFTINQITPSTFSINYPGLSLGYNLIGSRYKNYFNILVETGYLSDFKQSGVLFFKVSPLSLGNVVTGCRERVLTFGLLYDINGRDLIIIWQLLCFSYYGSFYAEE